MHGLLFRWLANAFALLLTSFLVGGIQISGFGSALFASAILGVINALVRPAMLFLTMPFNVASLMLFSLGVNAIMLLLTASVVSGFVVAGLWAALVGSAILAIISSLLSTFVID